MVFQTKTFITFIIISISLSLTSFAATNVGGPIHNNTTWTIAGSPYIVTQSVSVYEGITLTIDPGVRILFNKGREIFVDGQLLAQGTAQNPIIFTSAATIPNPGDWGSIEFTQTAVSATYNGSGAYINGSIIEYATIEYGRDAVFANGAAPYLLHVTVQNNIRGLKMAETAASIKESSFIDNSADNNGGAIYISYNSSLKIIDSTLTGNTSVEGHGGAIYISDDSSLTIIDSTFTGNTSVEGHGGAVVSSYSSTLTIINSKFTSNSADQRGGAIYSFSLNYSGSSSSVFLTVSGSTFTSNSAGENGGAISSYAEAAYDSSASSSLTITGSTFTSNSADQRGGAISSYAADNLYSSFSASHLTITGGTFTGNSADGGAIYSRDGFFEMEHSLISENFGGTAIGLENGIITSCSIINNGGDGITIFSSSQTPSSLTITNSNIFGNNNYNVVNDSSTDIAATKNYWGTTDEMTIILNIFDKFDDGRKGEVVYYPFLTKMVLGMLEPKAMPWIPLLLLDE